MGGRSGQSLRRPQTRPVQAAQAQSAPRENAKQVSSSRSNIPEGHPAANIPEKTIRAMAGIPSYVRGELRLEYDSSDRVKVRFNGEGVEMIRTLNFRTKTAANEYFRISSASPHKGKGYEIFAKQVKALQKAKFKGIGVSAAGGPGNSVYNGYYTWARFGYEPSNATDLVRRINQSSGSNFKNWYEMMNTKTGQALWKANGTSFYGEFDLRPRSDSMKTLKNYLKYRKEKN